jgi:hypothetical protein
MSTRYRLPKNLGAHEVEIVSGPVEGEVTVYPLGFHLATPGSTFYSLTGGDSPPPPGRTATLRIVPCSRPRMSWHHLPAVRGRLALAGGPFRQLVWVMSARWARWLCSARLFWSIGQGSARAL